MVKITVAGSIESGLMAHGLFPLRVMPNFLPLPSPTHDQSVMFKVCHVQSWTSTQDDILEPYYRYAAEHNPLSELPSFHFHLFYHSPEVQDDLDFVCLSSLSGPPFLLF